MQVSSSFRRLVLAISVTCVVVGAAMPVAAAPAVVGPGTCAPNADSVTFSVDRSEPEQQCYSGHGTASIGLFDVYHFYAGESTSGWFHWDYGDYSCGNTYSFTPYQQNDFPTSIHVCSAWHIN